MYRIEICTYQGKSDGYYYLKLVHNSARKIVRERNTSLLFSYYFIFFFLLLLLCFFFFFSCLMTAENEYMAKVSREGENFCSLITSLLIANAVNDHHCTFISTAHRHHWNFFFSFSHVCMYVFIYSARACKSEDEVIIKKRRRRRTNEEKKKHEYFTCRNRYRNKNETIHQKRKI